MGVYRKDFLPLTKDPYNNGLAIIKGKEFDTLRKAFYGGLVDTYIPKGENLYYYDVNSLYSYTMLKDMPVGVARTVKGHIDLANFFGFV